MNPILFPALPGFCLFLGLYLLFLAQVQQLRVVSVGSPSANIAAPFARNPKGLHLITKKIQTYNFSFFSE